MSYLDTTKLMEMITKIIYDLSPNMMSYTHIYKYILHSAYIHLCGDKCAKKTREAIKQNEETETNISHGIIKIQTNK